MFNSGAQTVRGNSRPQHSLCQLPKKRYVMKEIYVTDQRASNEIDIVVIRSKRDSCGSYK